MRRMIGPLIRTATSYKKSTAAVAFTGFCAAVVYQTQHEDFDSTNMRSWGNHFANRVQRFDAVSNRRAEWFEATLEKDEGVQFEKAQAILFRGEYSLTDEPTEKLAAEVLSEGKHPVTFPMRPDAFREDPFLNDRPTIGNEVLNKLLGGKDRWTYGGISHTCSFKRALDYTSSEGILILSTPKKTACVADHSARVSDQLPGREWEWVSSSIKPSEVAVVAEINDGNITAVHINPNFFDPVRKIEGDNQLGKFADMLDETDSKQMQLKQMLLPHIDRSIDHTKTYEQREASDIFELYARTTANLMRAHKSFHQVPASLLNNPRSLTNFLNSKLPHLPTLLEERQEEEFDRGKVDKLGKKLADLGLPDDFIETKLDQASPTPGLK